MKNNFNEQMLDLVKLNASVEKMYNHLAKLEIKGLIDSDEYKEYLSLIDTASDIINKKIRNFTCTPKELENYEILLTQLNRLEDHDMIIDVLDLTKNNKIRRTIMQLYYYSIINHVMYEETEDITKKYAEEYGIDISDYEDKEDYEDDIKEMYEEDLKEAYLSEVNEDDFMYAKSKVEAHLLLHFLEEEITNQKNKRIKNTLIRVKYRLIYILPIIERNFINNPKKCANPNLYMELYNYQVEKTNDDIKDITVRLDYENARAELDYLSGLSDEYLKNTNNRISTILRSIYLRMLLSMQLTKENDNALLEDKDEIDYKSNKTKEYVEKAYRLKKEISTLKKVDL